MVGDRWLGELYLFDDAAGIDFFVFLNNIQDHLSVFIMDGFEKSLPFLWACAFHRCDFYIETYQYDSIFRQAAPVMLK